MENHIIKKEMSELTYGEFCRTHIVTELDEITQAIDDWDYTNVCESRVRLLCSYKPKPKHRHRKWRKLMSSEDSGSNLDD